MGDDLALAGIIPTEWLKAKCVQTDTFVIIGYQRGSGAARAPLANLKIASFDGNVLRYAGSVATGFSEAVAKVLRERLDRILAPRCPVAGLKVPERCGSRQTFVPRSPIAG